MIMQHKRLLALSGFGLLLLLGLFLGRQWVAHAQTDPPVHPDGWDLSFGGDGQVETACSNYMEESVWVLRYAGRLQIQQDNKILLFAYCNDTEQFTLLRFGADGLPDPSFGENGRTTTMPSQGANGMPAQQSDGKIIIVGGDAGESWQVARYHINGTLDTSFGTNGIVAYPELRDQIGRFDQLLIQPNDQIIVRGENGFARLNSNGILDTTLNNVGYKLTNDILPKPNPEAEQILQEIAVQADGKLLLAFYTRWQKDKFEQEDWRKITLLRLESVGTFDQTFAQAGVYTVVETTKSIGPYDNKLIALQADGKILAANTAIQKLIRLNTVGELDLTFQMHHNVSFEHLLEDQRGYLILHGGYWTQRLLPNGGLDTSWGKNGQLDWNGGFTGLGLQNDGSLIVAPPNRLMRNIKAKEYPSVPTATPTTEPTPSPTPTPLPPEQRALALVYAVLDNNLGSEWTRLVNNIEAGAHPGVDVRLLIDGPAIGDAYVYQIQPDRNPYCPTIENPTCDGRYREGFNYQRFFTEDTARPHALYQFLVDSFNAYPQAPQISLTIIGHGSGWGANALPAQPSIWRDQNDTLGGMLWDDHTGVQAGSRSLSTLALGQAIHWATSETNRTLNLLYLDGCSMGMTEVAYELRNRADYLLASPNTDWATFAYDQLLPLVRYDRDGRALGEAWLAAEAALMRSRTGYPFTLALTDLRQITPLAATVTAFADALQGVIPTQRAAITLAYQQSDRFDSNYDATLDSDDNYLDLRDFAAQVQSSITDTLVISHAQAVQTLLSSVVITVAQQNGSPWLAEEQTWAWRNLGGLSIYAPLQTDEAKRRIYYTKDHLAWAADSSWDDFLAAFWAGAVNGATTTADLPVCYATTQGCEGLANPLPVQPPQAVFLPMVWR